MVAEITEHGHVLTPGRYVGAEALEDDDEGFEAKMQSLTEKLGEQMAKGAKGAELDQVIRQKLGGWGMSSDWRNVRSLSAQSARRTDNNRLVGSDLGDSDSRMTG